MAQAMSIVLQGTQPERLARLAERLGRPPSEIGALLLEEALRMADYPSIEFRDSPVGHLAYVRGSSLAVWEVAMVARGYGGDALQTAEHLEWPVSRVEDALSYAHAYADEITSIVEDNAAQTFESVQHILPSMQRVTLQRSKSSGENGAVSAT